VPLRARWRLAVRHWSVLRGAPCPYRAGGRRQSVTSSVTSKKQALRKKHQIARRRRRYESWARTRSARRVRRRLRCRRGSSTGRPRPSCSLARPRSAVSPPGPPGDPRSGPRGSARQTGLTGESGPTATTLRPPRQHFGAGSRRLREDGAPLVRGETPARTPTERPAASACGTPPCRTGLRGSECGPGCCEASDRRLDSTP